MSIRVGILGYGNLGKGVESAIAQNDDMELKAVFTRRNPENVKVRTAGVKVLQADELSHMQDELDVLILCGDISNGFFSQVIKGISDRLLALGLLPVVCNSNYNADLEESQIEMADANNYLGIIFVTATERPTLAATLYRTNTPVILVNRYIHSFETHTVCIDNYKGGYIAADYLTVSEATEGFSCYALILADSLNMRSAPDAGAGRVTSVSSGSYVDVSGFENGWFHVSYNGSTGFMSGDYLTLTDSKPAPVTTTTSGSSSSSSSSKGSSSSSSSSKGSSSLPSGGSAGRGSGTGADLVAEGERYLGVRYVYGGASPSGFDCSGFTMYVYAQFGYSLPHGANRQLSYGTPISKGDLQPGDLVFFYGTDGGDSSSASHVGLYVGDGTFIHASSGSSRCVKYSSLYESYYTNHYLTARRIVG